jgi:gliding motility associated protien GldN
MMLRKSLVQTLVEAVRSGEIRAFDPDQDDEFTTLLTPEELSRNFDAVDRTERRQKMDGSGDTTILIRGAYNWDEVRELIVKEDWFFDKHYSKMFVRIVGICPVRVYKKTLNVVGNEEEEDDGDVQKKQLFWVNYDESRPVLARTPSYNPSNDAVNLSYDDIFTMRRFSSYIQKESNPHNNRSVSSYTPNGYAAFLESERIKNSIFTWEHDLWEY